MYREILILFSFELFLTNICEVHLLRHRKEIDDISEAGVPPVFAAVFAPSQSSVACYLWLKPLPLNSLIGHLRFELIQG